MRNSRLHIATDIKEFYSVAEDLRFEEHDSGWGYTSKTVDDFKKIILILYDYVKHCFSDIVKKTYYLVFFQRQEKHNKFEMLLLTLELMHPTLIKEKKKKAEKETKTLSKVWIISCPPRILWLYLNCTIWLWESTTRSLYKCFLTELWRTKRDK